MSGSVLGKLFNGEVNPFEQVRPKCERYTQATERIGQGKRKLCATFTAEQQAIFDRMLDEYYVMASLEHTTAFVEGFKLGGRVMLEVVERDK